MSKKILVVALPIPGIWDAVDVASQVAKAIRANNPALSNHDVVQFPLVDGGKGTIDFLVTHTLGSFLEVEATNAYGQDTIVPIGFAGEDGKLAIIEMNRVAGVSSAGDWGTTFGLGELIQDALDEGAFSVLLGQEEPLACDAGLGACAALGVKFYNAEGELLDLKRGDFQLSNIAKVDASGRNFNLLSARFYIASASNAYSASPAPELATQLQRLADIFYRDANITTSSEQHSASAIEFGLTAFLGAERQEGTQLVMEASQIENAIASHEFSSMIVVTSNLTAVRLPAPQRLVELAMKHRLQITYLTVEKNDTKTVRKHQYLSLADAQLFQAPITSLASIDEKRRDFLLRLEKLAPQIAIENKPETVRA